MHKRTHPPHPCQSNRSTQVNSQQRRHGARTCMPALPALIGGCARVMQPSSHRWSSPRLHKSCSPGVLIWLRTTHQHPGVSAHSHVSNAHAAAARHASSPASRLTASHPGTIALKLRCNGTRQPVARRPNRPIQYRLHTAAAAAPTTPPAPPGAPEHAHAPPPPPVRLCRHRCGIALFRAQGVVRHTRHARNSLEASTCTHSARLALTRGPLPSQRMHTPQPNNYSNRTAMKSAHVSGGGACNAALLHAAAGGRRAATATATPACTAAAASSCAAPGTHAHTLRARWQQCITPRASGRKQ